jgi:hypothetical protein
LRLWSGITSSSSPSEARTISRKKRSPATVELPDNKTARHLLAGCSLLNLLVLTANAATAR